jgi:hypothetical protein
MVPYIELWLPILAGAAAVFVTSSVVWMALPIHKNDYKKLGEHEPAALAAIRGWALAPGMYMFPYCDSKTIKTDPAAQQKVKDGPWGTLTVMPKCWNMGQMLGLWFLNILILTALIGYIASTSLPHGATFAGVFRVVATAGILAYGGSVLTDSIWKGRPWSGLPGALFDAVVYAAVTGAVFAALWPKGALQL